MAQKKKASNVKRARHSKQAGKPNRMSTKTKSADDELTMPKQLKEGGKKIHGE
jgi:hypothetical protein